MLVLTRKPDESVIIAGSIEIKVLEIRGEQVSLGFAAPRETAIYRKEVYEAIEAENREAVRRAQDMQMTNEFLAAALRDASARGPGKRGTANAGR